jgi:hypothetical protein
LVPNALNLDLDLGPNPESFFGSGAFLASVSVLSRLYLSDLVK